MCEFIGIIFAIILLIILFTCFPFSVGVIILGCWLGGHWWWICAPLIIVGMFMDVIGFTKWDQ